MLTLVVLIAAITLIHMWMSPKPIEGFAASTEAQCNALTTCTTCADEDKCGWCSSTKKCHLKGRFGDSDGKCDARSFTTSSNQCTAPSTSLSTSTSGGTTYNEGREKRRLAMIKKYVDRIGTNYNALSLASSKTTAREYIADKLSYSETD